MAGFELATPCTPCKCATRLRYTPKSRIIAEPGAALADLFGHSLFGHSLFGLSLFGLSLFGLSLFRLAHF